MRNMLCVLIVLILLAGCAGGPTAVEPSSTPISGPTTTPDPTATEPTTATATSVTTSNPTSAVLLGTPTPTPQPTPTPESLRPLSVSVDYENIQGPLDTSRFLNVAVGGYSPLHNINWLPQAYDQLAAIGMEYIRLDHITDDAFYRVVWRSADGRLNYDFSRLNRVVIPILQSDMKPLLSLGYKPGALDPWGSEKQAPSDLNEWIEVVTAFVEHFKGEGYTGLYWEFWNEPDLAFFFEGSIEQYLLLYSATAQAIKRADPTAQVGGAADSSANWPGAKLPHLLNYIREHPDVPLDFVSYHDYADPDGDGMPPYELGWNVAAVEALMAEAGLGDRDIFITEWNLTPRMTTGPGADTDTNVGAAAVAVRLFNLLDRPSVKRALFFSPIEGYRSERIFNGDLGLLTVNYHRKALYNLFEMISYLGDVRLGADVSGENTEARESYALATRRDDTQETAILIWNYWNVPRTVDLSVTRLPYAAAGQNVQVTRYLIDADHANYYKDYRAGLRGYPVGPTELLLPIESSVTAATEIFTRRLALSANSVTLVILSPTDLAPTPGPVVTPPPLPPRNYAAVRPVHVPSTLDEGGWHTGALVDEITHSLPATMGWSSALYLEPAHDVWVSIDLGEPVEVDTVRLYPRDDDGYEGSGFPVDFAIQGTADGETWIDLVVESNYEPRGHPRDMQVFTFPTGRYSGIRLLATRLGGVEEGAYALQLAEVEVTHQAAGASHE